MELSEAYSKIYITQEEQGSIERYLGFQHTAMNILADLTPELYRNLSKGWDIPSEPEDIKKLIEDFSNIYSAMYKNSVNYMNKNLVRGTSKTNMENLGKEFNQIVSTTTDEDIAKRFTEYGNDALVHFRLGEGVPFLNAEAYRGENNASEKEIILAPFCRVDSKQKSYSDGSYTHYTVSVSAPKLQSVPQEDLDKLMEELTQGFAKNIEDMKEYEFLKEKIELIGIRYENADIEDKIEMAKDQHNAREQLSEKNKQVQEFKKKMQTLLKGLCKQKEQEIDKAKQVIEEDRLKREQEEEKRRKEENKKAKLLEINTKAQENPQHAQSLNSTILTSYQELLQSEQIYRETANTLGVSYTKNIANSKIANRIETIQNTIQHIQEVVESIDISESDSPEKVEEISKQVIPLMDGINFGAIQAEALPKIVNLHVMQSEHEIKKNLYSKVQKTIQEAKVQKYLYEKEQIQSEKIGIWGRLTGKQALQEEKINLLNLKIQLTKATTPEEKEKYSVRDMLADLYACAKTDTGFTPEINELYFTIKQCYNKEDRKDFQDEYIESLADKKIMQQQNKLPMETTNTRRIFGKTKAQTEGLRQENAMLRNQIIEENQKGNMNFCKVSDEQDAIAVFDAKLKSIGKATTEVARDKLPEDKSWQDGSTWELF